MPGQELASKLPHAAAVACTSRLAGLQPSVALPSRLFQHGEPTLQQTEGYLAELLDRDPASFLERYGKHLTTAELATFTPLSHDYEVGFWVSNLQAAAAMVTATATRAGRPHATALARNRRLAAMQQLHDAGEFFSMEAMQERDPLLYQHYLGQYEDEEQEPGPEEGGQKLSASLMRSYQQAQLQARIRELQREQEEEDDGPVSEHESDDDSENLPSTSLPAHTQPKQEPARPASLRGAAIKGIPSGGRKPVTAASAKPAAATPAATPQPLASATAAIGSLAGATAATAATAAATQQQQQHPAVQPHPGSAAGGHVSLPPHLLSASAQRQAAEGTVPQPGPSQSRTGVRFAEGSSPACAAAGHSGLQRPKRQAAQENREDRERQFVEEMEARFLSGQDAQFVDYAGIDANEQLDDYWLQQRGRDAEDAYFGEAGAGMDEGEARGTGADVDARERQGAREAGAERGGGGGAGQRLGAQGAATEGEAMDTSGGDELEEWERMAMDGVCGR